MEFRQAHLKPLGIVFQAYLDRHLAQAQLTLQSEWIANAQRIEELARKQQKLEAEAQTIASRSGDLDRRETDLDKREAFIEQGKAKAIAEVQRRREADLKEVRRLRENERFARWLDNTRWAAREFSKDFGTNIGYAANSAWRTFIYKLEDPRWRLWVLMACFVAAPVGSAVLAIKVTWSDRCFQNDQCFAIVRWARGEPEQKPRPKPVVKHHASDRK